MRERKSHGNFDEAYRLVQLAREGGILDDRRIKRLIIGVYHSSNPRFHEFAEEYIGHKALNNILWERDKQNYRGNSSPYRKVYQM